MPDYNRYSIYQALVILYLNFFELVKTLDYLMKNGVETITFSFWLPPTSTRINFWTETLSSLTSQETSTVSGFAVQITFSSAQIVNNKLFTYNSPQIRV